MLTVQPYSTSVNVPKRPAFKGDWDKSSIDEERSFIERQAQALDTIINDDYVPDKMKKPFKFFKVLYNAALDGLAVFGAVFFMKDFIKKGLNSKVAQKIVKAVKPAINVSSKGLKYAGEKAAEGISAGYKFVRNTSLGMKIADLYNKFAITNAGKVVIDYANKGGAVAKKVALSVGESAKKINLDKTTNGIATVLGIGSGLSGAYETAMKESPVKVEEDPIDYYGDEE